MKRYAPLTLLASFLWICFQLGNLVGWPNLFADSVSIYPIADTSLFEYTPTNNLGAVILASGTIGLGYRSRALIQFATADIPTNVVLISASLTLVVAHNPQAGGQSSYFDLHRVTQPWGEGIGAGSGRGSPAQAGEASWNARFFPDQPWTTPGAVAPGDFSPAISSRAFVGLQPFLFTNLLADVLFWVTHPDQNFGWILVSEREDLKYTARRFYSRENGADVAPTLVLEFTYLPEIHNVQSSGNQLTFDFFAQAGLAYFAQSQDFLSPGAWLTFTNFPAQPAIRTVTVSAPVTCSQRFYRVGISQNGSP